MKKIIKGIIGFILSSLAIFMIVENYNWINTCSEIISRGGICFVNYSYFLIGLVILIIGCFFIASSFIKKEGRAEGEVGGENDR